MTMGERIKQLRSAKGFTQEMLAEKMNVSRSAIAKWEADGGIPDVDNLIQLSFVLTLVQMNWSEILQPPNIVKEPKRQIMKYMTSGVNFMIQNLAAGMTACLVSISLQKIRISYTIINHQINHAAYME